MNRYQLEIAEIDRRHYLVVRSLAVAGAALIVIAALWSAGLPPTEWVQRAQVWIAGHSHVRSDPTAGHQIDTGSITHVHRTESAPVTSFLPGTDSSVSPIPAPLVLVSTSPGHSKSEGTAQIGTSLQNPQTYAGGALLANGARLAEIHRDRIILQRAGERLTLYVVDGNHPQPAERTKHGDELGIVPGSTAPESAPVALEADRLTEVIRAMPYYEDHLLSGLQVFPGQKASTFAQLGLNTGDIIVSIDNAPVLDVVSATDLLGQLTSGASLTVSVRREDTTRTLALNGSVVAKAVAKADPGMMADLSGM